MITAEVAVYPLKTNNATGVINDTIDTLKGANVNYKVNSMNTRLSGIREEVFNGLRAMFNKAQSEAGEVSMVVTITNSAD